MPLYYENSFKAEEMIIKSKYVEAISYYQKSFQYKKDPFVKDLYNVCICALKVKNMQLARNYFVQIGAKGATLNIFKKNYLKLLSPTNKYIKLYLKEYNIKKMKLSKDTILNFVGFNDQEVRKVKTDYDKIYFNDKKNDSLLFQYIQKYGFPSEENYMVEDRIDCYPSFCLVIWHQSKGKHFHEYEKILLEAINNGTLASEVATAILENHDGRNFGNKSFYSIECSVCDKKMSEKFSNKIFHYKNFDFDEYSKNRAKYLLDSFENTLKKNSFKVKNRDFRFGCFSSIFPTFAYDDLALLKEMLNDSIEIKLK
jgi:hypothetical protein